MKITLITGLLAISGCLCAAEKAGTPPADPFDLSQNAKKIQELGIPTMSRVQALERKASELYKSQNWKAAADANAEFARAANWLSNVISAGLQPYYGASYDDRKNFGRDLTKLVSLEKMANDLKEKRNRAMVIEAECTIKAGDREKGFGLLLKSLDLIDINDTEYWDKARALLYSMVEVKSG